MSFMNSYYFPGNRYFTNVFFKLKEAECYCSLEEITSKLSVLLLINKSLILVAQVDQAGPVSKYSG